MIVYIILGVMSFVTIISLIAAVRSNKREQIAKAFVAQVVSMPKSENDIIREDFLKFVSDSRDWAFEYIEEFQTELNNFVKEVGPLVEYFDKYGDKMSMGPNFDAMTKVSGAYKNLIKLLPDKDI